MLHSGIIIEKNKKVLITEQIYRRKRYKKSITKSPTSHLQKIAGERFFCYAFFEKNIKAIAILKELCYNAKGKWASIRCWNNQHNRRYVVGGGTLWQ